MEGLDGECVGRANPNLNLNPALNPIPNLTLHLNLTLPGERVSRQIKIKMKSKIKKED
jgi:hypothetical protein